MLLSRSWWLGQFGDRCYLSPDNDGGGGAETPPEGLSDNDKQAWERLKSQRDAAKTERDALKTQVGGIQTQLDQLLQEKQDREAQERARAEADATAKGEFERLANERKVSLDEANGKIATLTEQVTKLTDAVGGLVSKEKWEAIPEEVRVLYLGADDDPLAKLEFIPKAEAIIERLKGANGNSGGTPTDPPDSGRTAPTAEADKKALQLNTLRYG